MDMVIGSVYSFEVYPTAILGNNFNNLKLLSELDSDDANGHIDPQAMHAKIYPTLPEGSLDDYRAYTYYKFRTQSGETIVIGRPWINPATVNAVNSEYMWVKVRATAGQIPNVRASLVSNGFRIEEIKMGGNVS